MTILNSRTVRATVLNFFVLFLLIAISFSLSGCGTGPKTTELKVMLQEVLDTGFSKDLFEIQKFRRMGVYETTTGTGKHIALVYFDATLGFKRDYSMANWNALNLDTLIQVIGSGSSGVDGIKPEGNKVGDLLIVHGTLSLSETKKGQWTIETEKPVKKESNHSKEKGVLEQQADDIDSMLKEIQTVSTERLGAKDGVSLSKIHSFVRITRNRLLKRMRSRRNQLIVACGHITGTYYPLGNALATILTDSKIPSYAQQTEGSVENCRMVSYNYADIAVCQTDIAKDAFEGKGRFSHEKLANLRAICAWYPEAVQIFVRDDSSIKSIGDLKGKTIVAGQKESGTRSNALAILEAAGLDNEDLPKIMESPGSYGFKILIDKKADALFITEAYPPRALKDAAGVSNIRMLSISDLTANRLITGNSAFTGCEIDGRHFRGLGETVNTVAVTAILIGSDKLKDDQVSKILKIQYVNLDKMIKANPKGATISLTNGLYALPIPVHNGAKTFFANYKNKSDSKKKEQQKRLTPDIEK